jgi:hypothetical protein
MNPIGYIEKLINEHGSAAILAQQLEFAKDQFSALERQVSEFQSKTEKFEAQIAKLEAKLEIEQTNHKETKQDLQRFKDEHAEEIIIHKMVEFRRGKRTSGKWMGFCPKCHLPATGVFHPGDSPIVYCSGLCGWKVHPKITLEQIHAEVMREHT